MKEIKKIIAIMMILVLCMPFVFACGEKADNGNANNATKAGDSAGTEALAVEETPTDPPTPTEPPTEKPTEPPTEPPTDPADLPAPDIIGKTDTSDGFAIIPGARYYLWSPNSNMYLTADGDYKYAGVSQDDYTGKPEQMFVFEKIREDVSADTGAVTYVYKMRALGTKDSYLDAEEGSENVVDGQGVVLTSTPESEGSHEWVLKAQKKTPMKNDDGVVIDDYADIDLPLFSVTNLVAKKRCLDVDGVSKDAGHKIHLWTGGTANNQKWFFELVSDVESGKIIPRGLQELDY